MEHRHHNPRYDVLDPEDAGDYNAKVEPSVSGGRKMAARFLAEIGFSAAK
jgi:hypothetical protein